MGIGDLSLAGGTARPALTTQSWGSRRGIRPRNRDRTTSEREVSRVARRDQPRAVVCGTGRTAKAHDLLAPIYGWFTEGFDTADLEDAKALLDGLS